MPDDPLLPLLKVMTIQKLTWKQLDSESSMIEPRVSLHFGETNPILLRDENLLEEILCIFGEVL